jgi:predicted Zn-dependent protease
MVALGPTVAAVLVHEVVGHAAEELRPGRAPVRIGPDELSVAAYHPRQEGLDDEGVPVGRLPLVESGWLSHPVLDRDRASRYGGTPAGLAQAALHSGPPRGRATHLRVHPGSRPTATLLAGVTDGAVCEATSGAEFLGDRVMVAVSAAARLRSGSRNERLRPFVITLRLGEPPGRLIGIGNDVRRGRSARCVKGADSLPTLVEAPTLLLDGVLVHAG